MDLMVKLNGTKLNPFHQLGLKQNPFPQLGIAELDQHMRTLSVLAADPIPNTDYIRKTLSGWSSEFVELCCQQFRPGEMATFMVTFPDKRS